MMMTLLLLIPLLGAAAIIFAPARQAKWIALGATLVAFALSVVMAFMFDAWGASDQFDTWSDDARGVVWDILPQFGITLRLGADSVALLLVLLTTLLMPLCIWASFSAITDRLKEYFAWLLVLETAMIGVFLARDVIFFYICFELTLVPMYFLIAVYGGENRARASTKFFIYTFTGSLLTLAGVLYVAWRYADTYGGTWSFEIIELVMFAAGRGAPGLSATEQGWVLLALLAGFAVKVPLFPVHTWLPLAHTEAPTAGSVILAGVLLKLGTYGLYRFVLPMVPDGLLTSVEFLWFEFVPIRAIAALAIIGILYAALICWVQTDIKKLIAYSSVSHLGFCVLGLFALNPLGLQGSVLYMINHGLSTGALFLLVGMIYERYHTRNMAAMSGLARRMPVWAFFMVFFVLASVGLPGLNGFVSEFLCLIGAFTATGDATNYPGMLGPWYAAFAGAGMILAAMYLLIMVGKVVFGPLREPEHDHAHDRGHGHGPHAEEHLPADLNLREIGVLAPLAVLCVVIGFKPVWFTDAIEGSVRTALIDYPVRVQEATRFADADANANPDMQMISADDAATPTDSAIAAPAASVIPAQAGIQPPSPEPAARSLSSRLSENDAHASNDKTMSLSAAAEEEAGG